VSSYLQSVICEEVERAKFLKNQIVFPLIYPELSGLANRCVSILDVQIISLENLSKNLENYVEKSAWRLVRAAHRKIEMTEQWGIPPLYLQTKEIGLLNKLIFDICKEINLPLEHPSVACFSTQYYYTATFVDVIFLPLSESAFLLHLPDIYHEMGHYVSKNKNQTKLQMIGNAYLEVCDIVTEYFVDYLLKKQRERGPEATLLKIQNFRFNWQKNWIEEVFCDLFAVFLVGPAYAWSHIHLVTKNNPNIYEVSLFGNQEHPSDEARMQILLIALKILGYDDECSKIKKEWNKIRNQWGEPSLEFNYAYPYELLERITHLFFKSIKSSPFKIMSSSNGEKGSVRKLLNDAWENFWNLNPKEFRQWEIEKIGELNKGYFG